MNGYKLKSDSELTEYQKKIDKIDNVILCMAEAERMVAEIGIPLLADTGIDISKLKGTGGKSTCMWSGRKFTFR